MAENQTGAAEQASFTYSIKVEDAGPATKKVSIEIPAERISAKLEENFGELRSKAHIPGFRPGHAPRKLVEKKFQKDVRDDVKRQLISESYQQAIENNKLSVIGEPEFEAADKIELPASGALSYSFQVEVAPDFVLPELAGIEIKKPKVEVNDTHLQQAMDNLRQQQGTLVPVENRGLEAKDYVTADVQVKVEGKEVGSQKDAMFILAPGHVGGIFVEDLVARLAGLKGGESRSFTMKAPETHANKDIAGKDVEITVTLKDIKKLELAEINDEFLANLGFKDQKELTEALMEQLQIRVKNDVQEAMRNQVKGYLFEKVTMELPAKLTQRQTQRIIQRRASDLYSRGIPLEQIQANLEKIQAGADAEALRELKMDFILSKIAEQFQIEVSEAELNGQIAMVAAQYNERPEKVKQQFAKDGTLTNMYIRMRENRAIDKVLESAKVEEVEVKEEAKKDEEKKQ